MKGRFVRREHLDSRQRAAMFELLAAHFTGVAHTTFLRDLADKNWVVWIEDEEGRLRGFSTLRWYRTSALGAPADVVCSGDTIVDPSARASTALARTWLDAVFRLRGPHRGVPLYWLLICSGFRTYRFLPVFWQEFWPRFHRPTPAVARDRMDRLAHERWGDGYARREGIVRLPTPQRLRGEEARTPEGRIRDPHVAFFLQRNPGWTSGDELVCLAEISPENLTPVGHRLLRAEAGREHVRERAG